MKYSTLLLFYLSLSLVAIGENCKSKISSLPFDMVGSYMVVDVRINNSPKLKLILDSGVSTTLITELNRDDSISLKYTEKTSIKGLGSGNNLLALTSMGNTLQAGKMNMVNQTIYVLEQDIFNLSKHTGTKINGILGSDFFEGHIVKIDYNNRRITFFRNDSFNVPLGYSTIPMIQESHKMFIQVPVTESNGTIRESKMLVDTGAELAGWFRSYGKKPIQIPARKIHGYIGQGLNGEIKGYFGRIPQINMGGFLLKNPVVSFPDSISITDAIFASDRDGTIGSQILSRFNLIFDQKNGLLYLKPNWKFKKVFSYNIAGIELILSDPVLVLPEVLHVWKDSPAEFAGVKAGDRIFEINGLSGFKSNIQEMKKTFEKESDRPLEMLLLRGEKTIKVNVEMKSRL